MTRIAVVDNQKLKDMSQKRHVQNLCPVNRSGSECISFEGEKLRIDENLCIGCGICVKAAPDAIKIINLPAALDKEPIHQYGDNSFRLYSLPTPVFGKVVGIVGRNGIGKSTAIKILAGALKPNFGDWKHEGETDYARLVQRFKGSEAQHFFEKVRDGQVSISYKIQNVAMIARAAKGKVGMLLKKITNTNPDYPLDRLVKELDLADVLDNDISNISGGELQRVAIAATVLKKANFYVFDEPTSFLDIKQRIRVAEFISSLANEHTAVMVVEHDLIILDYMTDLVHIMYGDEGAYGICSQLKTTREGINSYLHGFLKEDNVRFRENAIKFEKATVRPATKGYMITGWKGIEKKLGKFHVTAAQGELKKHHVVGVLGENGIGKTTFVKILAGVEKPDAGEVLTQVRVAYKPQYLSTDSEDMVMVLLQEAMKKHETTLIRPLDIKPLLEKKLCELSGGELQRVAICYCLSQDADLVLMDEPSAYLDVEQRLIISKVIKDVMEIRGTCALIVDHDLLFVDYLSDSLIVFDGKPAVSGAVHGPFKMEEGMNKFLTGLGITMRRDKDSHRPRVNKPDSQLDREQRSENKLYYS